jgi:hypothetical protein
MGNFKTLSYLTHVELSLVLKSDLFPINNIGDFGQ